MIRLQPKTYLSSTETRLVALSKCIPASASERLPAGHFLLPYCSPDFQSHPPLSASTKATAFSFYIQRKYDIAWFIHSPLFTVVTMRNWILVASINISKGNSLISPTPSLNLPSWASHFRPYNMRSVRRPNGNVPAIQPRQLATQNNRACLGRRVRTSCRTPTG